MGREKRIGKVVNFLAILFLLVGCTPTPVTPAATAVPTTIATGTRPRLLPPATPALAAPTPTMKTASEQPRYGGALALPQHSDPPSLDVHRNMAATVFGPVGPIYNGVVQYDQSNKVVPDLAQRWEISPDGKVYVFYLHKGVKWHDGRPFTSADAKFSLERLGQYPDMNFVTEAIDKIDALDEKTLKITLKYRQAGFLNFLGHGRVLIAPRHVIEAKGDLKRDAIGTGPFKLKEYLSGVSFRMEKNKEYFVKERPYVDTIIFYVMRDTATRFAAFRTGRLQIYGHTPTNGELRQTHVDILKKELPQVVVRRYQMAQSYGLMPTGIVRHGAMSG